MELKQIQSTRFYKTEGFLNFSFFVLLAVLVASRALLFFTINLDFIDSDMPFMWAGVKDYSEGIFYEPRFYGQDYNTFMESLVAVPFYWLGMPVYYALPLAAHLVTLFPYVFTASYLFYNGRKENAILIISLLLCLSNGFHVMTSLPRGISGVFFTSFFILSILNPHNLRYLALNSILAVLGYFVTPNSVIITFPFLAFLFFHNYRNLKYYFVSAACVLSYIPFYFIFDKFYKDHPDYVVYGLNYYWSPKCFIETIQHLDASFAHVSFFVEENCFLLLATFLLLGIALFRINRIAFLTFLSFLFIILVSFFASKVREGVVWPFYSLSRMYIGIPMALALFTIFFHLSSRTFTNLVVLIALSFSAFKFVTFKKSLAYHTDEKRWNGVHLVSLKTVQEGCDAFMKICKTNQVDFMLISNTFWLSTYLNYGGTAIHKDFPASQETFAERRYWAREANADKIFKRFLLISVNFDFDKFYPDPSGFKITRLDDYGMMLIEENTLKNKDFIQVVRKSEGAE